MDAFKKGYVNKEDLASALRAQLAAEDATKSPQRDEAEEYYHGNQYKRPQGVTRTRLTNLMDCVLRGVV
eukprot:scaffold26592_cov171-Skeletonema_menzelii.AAC.3